MRFQISKALRLVLGIAGSFLSGVVLVQGQSALDGFDPNTDGLIRVVVVQADGKILIGGVFISLAPNGAVPVRRNRIARLNPDGRLDITFNPNANATVRSIVVQADGKTRMHGRTAFDPKADSEVLTPVLQFPLRIIDITRAGDEAHIIYEATDSNIYRLERKLALTDPTWQSIMDVGDQTLSASGPAQFIDPGAIGLGNAFYRVFASLMLRANASPRRARGRIFR